MPARVLARGMAVDTTAEIHEHEAEGWQRGLYDDVKVTFRAPVVNWIFRTLLANEPAATRYLWGQVKPLFETEACLSAVDEHRGAVRVRTDPDRLAAADLDLAPGEFRELQGQLATFDAVVPRLSVLFEVADRGLQGDLEPSGDPAPAATRPHGRPGVPADRRPPTMATVADSESALPETVSAVRSLHGLEEGLPSVYRCLAQWPDAFRAIWGAAAPELRSEGFRTATEQTADVAERAVTGAAYAPRLAPADFAAVGLEDEAIAGLRDLFAEFNRGAVETVLPAVHVLAAAVGAGSGSAT